jgi:hypothetical protein
MRLQTSRHTVAVAAVLAVLAGAPPAAAQERIQTFGRWVLKTDADRFGDGATAIAIVARVDGTMFAARCITGDLSLAVSTGRRSSEIKSGTAFQVKFRVDERPVLATYAMALNDYMIEVAIEREIMAQLVDAKEAALRFESPAGTSWVTVYDVRGGRKPIERVLKDCPDKKK